MIGSTVGRYRILSKQGEGGMGSVWLAEDPVLGRSVAIKVLPEHAADSPGSKERLLREARAACSLNHAGIAAVYEAGEDDGRIWIAFEHVDGETIAERVKREGPLPVEEALRIARGAAAALGHAHDQGILHRDVTSGNLMVDRHGAAKLVDFGLTLPEEPSRRTRDTTRETPGTVGYIAPEVVKGERGDRRADLYGLGVVLYEMLTGHLPFERERAEAVLYAVVHDEPVPPRTHRPELPSGVEAIVLRALAKDPVDRFANAEEMARALATGAPVVGSGKGIGPRPPLRRNALVALALTIAAATAWYLLRPAQPRFDSVAVLPLELPGENAQEIAYLATGLGDALTTRLGRVSGLRVTPWVTSSRFPPDATRLSEIGSELGVQSLVVGSLRQGNDSLHVTVSLHDVATGRSAWSKEVRETRTGLLQVQDVLSLALAQALRGRLTPEEEQALARGPTRRAEAYDHYLRGAAALRTGTRGGNEEALARFETALSIDPRLAEAHVGVGAVYAARDYKGWSGTRSPEVIEEWFSRALEIDPDLIEAHRGLAQIALQHRNEDCLRIARQLRDAGRDGEFSVDALLAQAVGMYLGGLADEAIPLFRTVQRLDPAGAAAPWFLLAAYNSAGDHADAISTAEGFLQSFGEDAEVRYLMAGSHLCLGNRDEARRNFERSRELFGDDAYSYVLAGWAVAWRELEGPDSARTVAREGIRLLESRMDEGVTTAELQCDLARLYAVAGDTAKVRETGRRLREKGGAWCSVWATYQLVCAYDEIGDDATANDLLLEQAERFQRLDDGGSTGPFGPFFMVSWLHECSGDGIPGPWDVRHLPAYETMMEALRNEDARRRALYGAGG